MIRSLRVARATAMKARTQAINALKGLLVTAPAELREQLRDLPAVQLVRTTATLELGPVTTPWPRPGWACGPWAAATKPCRPSSRCWMPSWTDSRTAAPKLVALFGVGPDSAGALLVAAGRTPIGSFQCRLRDAVRLFADPGLLRQDPPASAQSGWGSPGQRRPTPDRGSSASPRPTDQGLPGPPDPRGQVQEGSDPLFEALCGSGGFAVLPR